MLTFMIVGIIYNLIIDSNDYPFSVRNGYCENVVIIIIIIIVIIVIVVIIIVIIDNINNRNDNLNRDTNE